MSASRLIGNWALGVWINLGRPPNLTPLTISGYVTQPSTLGTLNNLIGTCYSGSGSAGPGTFDYDLVPDIGSNELALVEQIYRVSYFTNLATATMGMGACTIPWTSLGEGDSRITRANGATIGKEYREMSKDANTRLNYLVNAYLLNSVGSQVARQVLFLNPPPPGYADGDGYGPILGSSVV